MASVAPKISLTGKRHQNKVVSFGEEITGTEVTNLKTVRRSSLGEDIGFGE